MKCIDTSVLIDAEHDEYLREQLKREPISVPAMAAAEFLVGVRLVKKESVRERAQTFYDQEVRPFVVPFTEAQAQILADLISSSRRAGRELGAYDAAIAAAALELGCPIVAADNDFDGIEGLKVEKI